MKYLIAFIPLLLFSCTKDTAPYDDCLDDSCLEFHPIHLRVKNATNFDLTYVQVGGNTANFEALNSGDTSLYQFFPEGGYRYNYVKIKTATNDSFHIQPIDYVGETPLEEGYYTYVLSLQNGGNFTYLSIDCIKD